MTMNGQVQLPASREVVWAKLNDPEVLKSCIPGSEQFDRIAENEFQAVATVKVGPVKARWKGKVRLSELDPRTAIASPAKGKGAPPASPKAAPRCRSAIKMAARCSPMTWRRRSAASSPSSASV